MEYQISNEISEFWYELVPPICLGVISIICFLWVIGKDNRLRLMKYFVEDKGNQIIEENGILIPQKASIRYAFVAKLLNHIGLDSIRPIAALFLVFLFFYGLNNTLLHVFQPLLTFYPSNILYAAGVDEEIITTVWMHYPSASISDLYSIITQLTEVPNAQPVVLLYSVQAFIRFDLVCCFILFVFLFFRSRKVSSDKSVYIRLLLFVCILFIILGCTLLAEIHQKNNEIKQMCYQAYSILDKNNTSYLDMLDSEKYQHYLELVRQDKQWVENRLFYGAYGITNRYAKVWDFIVYIYQELCRVFTCRLNNPYQ